MRLRTHLFLVLTVFIFYIGTGVSFAQDIRYTYDDLNRLIKAEYGDGMAIEYTYDEVGNRLSKHEDLMNNPPTAVNDNYIVSEGGSINQAAPGVLVNDKDVERDSLTAILASDVSHGSLTLNADGSFIYIHDGSETTRDTFTYKANDGAGNGNIATVTITINGVNDAPTAVNDAYVINKGGTLNQAAPGVLANDIDAEGDSFTAMLVRDVSHGNLTLNADGSFIYVHDGSATTSDSFTYKTNDGMKNGNTATVTITIKAVIFLNQEGWPVTTGKSTFSSPTLCDIDGDGDMEVVISSWSKTYVFHHDGTTVTGWPITTGANLSSSALGDIDGDNDLEIVVAGKNICALHHDGTVVSGWPVEADKYIASSPALGDIDGDGDMEVVIGTMDGKVYAFHHNGTVVSGWPVEEIGWFINSSPALGDIDGDGDLEIVVGAESRPDKTHAFHHDGTPVSGWPVTTGGQQYCSPALGDIDGDGDIEVVIGSDDRKIYAFHHNGIPVNGWPVAVGSCVWSSPALGDIDGDGDIEVVVGIMDGEIYALHHSGTPVSGWPVATEKYIISSPALGDIDGDGDIEVVIGSNDSKIYGLHHDGTTVSGWPVITGGEVGSSPALGDIDGDGDIEIVVGSKDGKIYCIDSSGTYDPSNIEWAMFHHDARHTGFYGLPSTPIPDAGGPYTALEGTPITFDGSGSSDPNGDTLQYRWDFNNDGVYDTDWLNEPTVTYTYADDYTGTVKLKVSDGFEQPTDTAEITVSNVAPTIISVPVTGAIEGQLYTYQVQATDPGIKDIITYLLETELAGMSINPNTGVILWTPIFVQSGRRHHIKVVAQDNAGASSKQEFDVQVISINHAPQITPAVPDPAAVDEDSSLVLDLTSYETDVEDRGTTLNWTVIGAEYCSVSGENSEDDVLTFTPQQDYFGQDSVALVLTDSDGLMDTQNIILTWTSVNDAPVVTDIPDRDFAEGGWDTSVDLDSYVEDVDNPNDEITWTYSGNTNVEVTIDSETHKVTFSSAFGWAGQEIITFTATDPEGLTDSDTVTVTVTRLYGSLSGKVTDEIEGLAVEGVWVKVYNWDTGVLADSVQTLSDGTYIIENLASGNYKIYVDTQGTDYVSQYYDRVEEAGVANEVCLTAGANISDVNFCLPVLEEISLDIHKAYNPIAFSVIPDDLPSPYKASQLIKDLAQQGINVRHLMQWKYDWIPHRVDLAFTDFELDINKGIFIEVISPNEYHVGRWTIKGRKIPLSNKEKKVEFHTGWNLISLPTTIKATTAKELHEQINSAGVDVDQIMWWDGDDWRIYWKWDDLPLGNYELVRGRSYFIHCNRKTTWKIE